MSGDLVGLAGEITQYVTAAAGAYGGAVLAQTQEKAATATVDFGRRLAQRIFGVRDDGEALPEVLADVAADPDDPDGVAALRKAIRKALSEDEELAGQVRTLVKQAQAAGATVTASGEGAVAVHSSPGVIVAGRGATIQRGNRATAVALAVVAFVAGAAVLVAGRNFATTPTGARNGMIPTPSTSPHPETSPTPSPTESPTPTPSPSQSSPASKRAPKQRSAPRTGTPPQPVTGLNSARIQPGYTQTVTVRWNPQSDAASFDIHYTTTGSPQHKSVDKITNTTATSYEFTAYQGETSCMYIRARNKHGVSPWSTGDGHCFQV